MRWWRSASLRELSHAQVKRSTWPCASASVSLDNEVIAADLQALLTPTLFAQQAYFRQLGMRKRILNLSLMLAAVLTMLWRQVPSVGVNAHVSTGRSVVAKPKYRNKQLASGFWPSVLFERLFMEPQLSNAGSSVTDGRQQPVYSWPGFEHVWIAESSTLEALFRKR